MLNLPDTFMFSSVFNFPKVTFPEYSLARFSIIGPTSRQGPHHGAQQSTSTSGYCLMNESKVESVIVTGESGDVFPQYLFNYSY
jgi:hypothetical protein